MNELKSLLREGRHSLVVRNADGRITTYDSRGVMDLYNINTSSPGALSGSDVADKVVGAGAAALMAIGGVRRVYAGVISLRALDILHDNNVEVEAGKVVPQIINRAGTGRCPVEILLDDADGLDEMFRRISIFVENLKKSK